MKERGYIPTSLLGPAELDYALEIGKQVHGFSKIVISGEVAD